MASILPPPLERPIISLACIALLSLGSIILGRVVFSHAKTTLRERQAGRTAGCKPPQHTVAVWDPVIGLDFVAETIVSLFSAKHRQYMKESLDFFRRHGNTYGVYRWTWRTVNTCDPLNVQHMLAKAFDDFELPALRIEGMERQLGTGIFVMRRAQWRPVRALLRPSFTAKNMAPLLSILEGHFASFARCVPDGGRTVDLQPLFFALTMDTATEFLMGKSTEMLARCVPGGGGSRDARSEIKDMHAEQFVRDYFLCCEEAVSQMQIGPLGKLRWNRGAQKSKRRIWAYVDRFVDQALDSDGQHSLVAGVHAQYNLLEELARSTNDREVLRHQILHVLLAGRDTTACLLSNLFFTICRDQRVLRKLADEIRQTVGDDAPSDKQLKDMTYLKWCINESLRLHPVVPTNARDAAVDTTLPRGGGPDGMSPLYVRKGTPVLYSVFAMHRLPEVYGERVDEFIPERWDGLRPGWAYLPFNGGPRICLGQQLALTEAAYITVRMLQTFKRILPRDCLPWTELYTLSMCSRNGVKVAAMRT